MTQAVQQPVQQVPPVAASVRMLTIPAVAMKVALGAVAEDMPGGVKFAFEGDVFVLHPTDYATAKRAGARVKAELPKEITATKFIEAYSLAQKYVAEEVFRPGVKRIIYYPSVTEASAFYRCVLPSLYMNRSTKVTAHVSAQRSSREAQWYDVVVIQLDHSKGSYAFAKCMKEMGKKIIFEFDDDFSALESWHPQYEKYRRPEVQEEIIRMLDIADLVIVTTEELQRRYLKKTATRIEVVPNLIPLDDWPKAEPHGTDEFRILWSGSPSHFGDLEVVSEALWRFARGHKDVKIVFFGRAPKLVPTDIRSKITVIPFTTFADYPAKLAAISADVAIAPLSDNAFNRAKSPLKLLEYGACGYPVIASDVGPYRIPTGSLKCVTLCSGEPEWLDALAMHHDDPGFRAKMARNALEYARKNSIEANLEWIEGVYASL